MANTLQCVIQELLVTERLRLQRFKFLAVGAYQIIQSRKQQLFLIDKTRNFRKFSRNENLTLPIEHLIKQLCDIFVFTRHFDAPSKS